MNGRFLKKIFFSLLFLCNFYAFSQDNTTVITIENARNTRYEKDKETKADVIVLSGDVKVSVVKGSDKNVITADEIRYDRAHEMMYAQGNVSLEQTTSSSGGMNVSASSLMFNTSTLEGIFDDGRVVQTKSDALNLPSGSTLVVASDIFGRSQSNTIAFKNGQLTFCDDEEPHWHINANRIWLLPGGEFAFFNAFLFVGVVPVLYLPAFYYPKDELIFNPVFGYKRRDGYFIQTTTYLYGRKPLDTTSSTSSSSENTSDGTEKLKALFNFIKPSSLKEQKLEGLVLHNLEEDFKGDTSNYLKILGDYYSNLGIVVGVDGVFKPKKVFSNLEFNANLGFSNTVFYDSSSGEYLPFTSAGSKIHDSSNLLGLKLPFRYGAGFKFSMNKPFSLSMSLPVYSDPFFKDDFTERSETMDWISYLSDSASNKKDEETVSEVSSFTWTMNSSYSVPLPDFIKPYINTFSLNLNSSLVFSSMTNSSLENSDVSSISETDFSKWKNYSPQRKFYYPSSVTPLTFNGTLSGTLIDFSTSKAKSSNSKTAQTFVAEMIVPNALQKYFDESKEENNQAENEKNISEQGELSAEKSTLSAENESLVEKSQELANSQEKNEQDLIPLESFPKITSPSFSITNISGLAFSMKYSVRPNLSTQLVYDSAMLETPEDFDWNKLKSSMYTLKIPVTLDNNLSYGGNFFNISSSYSYNPVFQRHPYIYINDGEEKYGYSKKSAESLIKTDYAAEKQDVTNSNTVSLKPFTNIKWIKDSGITWRSSIRLIRTEFLADEYDPEVDNPQWKYHTVDWTDKDSITTNSLDFTVAGNELDGKFTQSLTLTTTLRPQLSQYYGTLKFGFPYTNLSFEAGIKKKSIDDDTWVKQPFKQALSLSLFKNTLKFSESYNYDLEEKRHDAFKTSLVWKSLSFSYVMSYTYGFDFESASGWIQKKEKDFLPYSLSFSFSPGTKTFYTWKNRVSMGLGLSTSIVADLLKPTDSYFVFNPSISFKIQDFLTLTFSSSSRNSVVYRYFGNEIGIPGETNILKDLWNSFRFDNEEVRKSSGFKLKSLKFDLTHELHDWDFTTSFKIEPRLITGDGGKKNYDFNPYITISILWRPMSAMKAEILDEYGKWSLQ